MFALTSPADAASGSQAGAGVPSGAAPLGTEVRSEAECAAPGSVTMR